MCPESASFSQQLCRPLTVELWGCRTTLHKSRNVGNDPISTKNFKEQARLSRMGWPTLQWEKRGVRALCEVKDLPRLQRMDGNESSWHTRNFQEIIYLVHGEIKLSKFTAKRNFENPKPRESEQRHPSITTHGVTFDEEDLVNRILYDLSCYPHIHDHLVPWRSLGTS